MSLDWFDVGYDVDGFLNHKLAEIEGFELIELI